MATALLEPRVADLEHSRDEMMQAIASMARTVEQTSREMREFKDEMSEFKDEMREFKDEMSEFKDEMDSYRQRGEAEQRAMNRRWGELANKMGTMAEDLVAPSIPRILRTLFGCPDDLLDLAAIRMRRRSAHDRSRSREFDFVAACGDYLLINETKSSLKPTDVDEFVETLSTAREFFPEHAERRVVGALASLYVDESLARYAERNGLIILSFGDEGMDLRNSSEFSPRLF